MHREYHPDEMRHLESAAFGSTAGGVEQGERALVAFTALLGVLIGADILLGASGFDRTRFPFGLAPMWIAAILGAIHIVYGALQSLLRGRVGADLALAQACLAALILGQPFVAAEVVFIALVGEVLEAWTFARTRRALGGLVERAPRTARVRRDGHEVEIAADHVAVGDHVVVLPGERIPVDGTVLAGRSTVDQSDLTGESLPVDKGPGDTVYSGTINQYGAIEAVALKVAGDSMFGQVLRLVAAARGRKARIEKVADRLARYFLPVVELIALATLVAGYLAGWPDVWSRTVAVLVVACPCGLVLATPAAMLASMAWLARHGVLIKAGSALESLAACDTFAFDKTGTLTTGTPQFAGLVALGGHDHDEVLRLAASAEAATTHPLGATVVNEAQRRSLALFEASEVTVLPGAGVAARCSGEGGRRHAVLVGNPRLLAEHKIALDASAESTLDALDARAQTALIVVIDGVAAGVIGVHDPVRPEAHDVIHELRHAKVREIAVLTGDREPVGRAVAKRIHADTVLAELLPVEKARWIEERQAAGHRVAMVGDGINDAPAVAQADAGIALGGMGADLTVAAGGLVILGDSLRVLPDLLRLARSTVSVIRQNILGFAFGLNAVAMLSATFGILGPVAAAVLHQAGSLLVLFNSMRLLAFGDWAELPPFRQARGLADRISRLDDRLDIPRLGRWVWRQRRAALAVAGALLLLFFATSGWTAIAPDEVGALQRFGRYQGELGPGLHLRWPPPIERVTVVAPDRVRSLEIGFRAAAALASGPLNWEASHGRALLDPPEDEGLLLTGDGRYVELAATLHYTIDRQDPESIRHFVFGLAGGDAALRPMAESAVRETIGRRELLDLLTVGRLEVEEAAAALLRSRLRAGRFGVAVRRVAFQDIHPPLAVLDAYRDVSRAKSDQQRSINEATALGESALAEAEGRSSALKSAALASRGRQLAIAASAADTFSGLREARGYAPALTDLRLFWKMVADALGGKTKLVLDEEPGRHRHLLLPGRLGEGALPALPAEDRAARPP
jgi:Cu+-exporting ATPase